MADKALNKKQVAAMVGVGLATIDRWESKGAFPKRRKFGARAVRWMLSDIEAWIKSKGETENAAVC